MGGWSEDPGDIRGCKGCGLHWPRPAPPVSGLPLCSDAGFACVCAEHTHTLPTITRSLAFCYPQMAASGARAWVRAQACGGREAGTPRNSSPSGPQGPAASLCRSRARRPRLVAWMSNACQGPGRNPAGAWEVTQASPFCTRGTEAQQKGGGAGQGCGRQHLSAAAWLERQGAREVPPACCRGF